MTTGHVHGQLPPHPEQPVLVLGFIEGGLRPQTLAAAHATGLPLLKHELHGDEAYFELLAYVWQRGQTFCTLEQDIVPHAQAYLELLACPRPWCAFAYEYPPFGLYAGMGCAKFGGRLLRRYPEAFAAIASWSDAKHPLKHWCRVDGWLKYWLIEHGVEQHVHGAVEHLHRGRPAHDCVTAADVAALRAASPAAIARTAEVTAPGPPPTPPPPQPARRLPTFSFLVPTHREDRPLWRCLDSILPQLDRGDEVLVIGDVQSGPLPRVKAMVEGYDKLSPSARFRYLELDAGLHDYGHSQLNYGLEHARGEWLHCNDDDDIWAPGAVAIMRQAAADAEDRPILFRFQSYHRGQVFWIERGRIARHWIGGHCLVCPNLPGKVGRFGQSYQGDFDMIASTIELLGGPERVVWREEIICIARPASQAILEPVRV